MNKEKCKRIERTRKKARLISIRITEGQSKWMRKEEYSPTSIFTEALKELGYKEDERMWIK